MLTFFCIIYRSETRLKLNISLYGEKTNSYRDKI